MAACRCSPAFRRWHIWSSRSAGEHVKVDVLVQPGQDPHTFEPTPQQVLALGRAAVFFKIDMPFENVLLEKVRQGNRRLMVVDTTAGIEKRKMDAPCGEHAGSHDHDHETPAGEPRPARLALAAAAEDPGRKHRRGARARPIRPTSPITSGTWPRWSSGSTRSIGASGRCWRRIAAGRSTCFIPASAISPTPTD